MKVGGPASVKQALDRIAQAGHQEVMYNPSGRDVARELEAFARIGNAV
jgi:5,10-methylenetetrahydromethanopterin reductase